MRKEPKLGLSVSDRPTRLSLADGESDHTRQCTPLAYRTRPQSGAMSGRSMDHLWRAPVLAQSWLLGGRTLGLACFGKGPVPGGLMFRLRVLRFNAVG